MQQHWHKWLQAGVYVWESGTSLLGEYWYVEGDTPLGPWVYGRKIMTHDRYTFYEAAHHPFLDQQEGRMIFFSGTYTDFLSGINHITPRYDYNLLMYRMDLADQRLFLPVPVYQVRSEYLLREHVEERGLWDQVEAIPFFALPPDRKWEGVVAAGQRAFYGLKEGSGSPHMVPLYQDDVGKYSLKANAFPQQVCWVWKNPNAVLFLDRKAKPVLNKPGRPIPHRI